MKLESNNFYLRLVEKGDAQILLDFELKNSDFFVKTSPTRNEDYFTLEGQQKFIDHLIKLDESHSFLMFNQQDQLIGWVSLFEILAVPNINSCFLGYRIDEDYQGKGYTTQAAKLVLDYAFNTLKLHRIEAGVLLDNFGSQRVLEKNGFIQEGINRKNVQINGVWRDHYIYGCLNPNEN